MLVDTLLQHKVKGRVDRLVEEVGGLENKRAKLVDQGGQRGGRGNEASEGVNEVPNFASVIAQQLQDLLPTIVAQVGDHVSNQGNIRSQNDNAADDSIPEDNRNVNIGNGRNGCSYKDFMACKPKEFDGKGGVIAYICWVEKMEAVQDISGYRDNQKVKYSSGSLTGRALTWWSSEVRTKGREAAVGMTWEYFKALMKEDYCPSKEMQRLEMEFWNHAMSAILKAGVLTDEAVRNGSLKRTYERREDGEESSKEGNVKGNNKRTRTGKVFAINTNPVRKEAGSRLVNLLNARNPTTAYGACYECGGTDRYKSACPRAFVIGADEALQDPDIVTGTFSLNNHYATMLFDSGVDYSFVSTTFVPLFDIEPRNLGFSYEIEIVSGQLVEINKVIRDCNLEIKGHTFDIDLILFRHGSFDVIIGMDWFSRHKVEIICHEWVVRIPLPHGEMLRVYGERPEEKVKRLMSAKAEEPKLEDITII
ncbi:putative reverse transcriptase domain-containing protein [Tanacetum coccineum]